MTHIFGNTDRPGYDKKTGLTIIPRLYPNFDYPERFCPFCEHELVTINAIHDFEEPIIFKSIMICDYKDCEAFDEDAHTAYARVYYSSEEALRRFEEVLLKFSVEAR